MGFRTCVGFLFGALVLMVIGKIGVSDPQTLMLPWIGTLIGVLVLGSADAGRFQMGMGTAFLERIAETASASLSKLIE